MYGRRVGSHDTGVNDHFRYNILLSEEFSVETVLHWGVVEEGLDQHGRRHERDITHLSRNTVNGVKVV